MRETAEPRGRVPSEGRHRVAVITPLFPPGVRGGGPIRTLGALVRNAPAWAGVHVFTNSRDHGATVDMVPVTDRPSTWEGVDVTYARTHTRRGLTALYTGLSRFRPDVLYVNSYWSLAFSQWVMVLRRLGVLGRPAVVIAPRGEFAPAALAHHRARKRLLRTANRLSGTHAGVVWHASSPAEADDVRRYIGAHARVIIRENDSLLPVHALPADPGRPASPVGTLRAVFLGRLVEHKGPHLAAVAAAGLGPGVSLDLYGPEEDRSIVERLKAIEADAGGRIRLRGTVANEDVRALLQEYDVLVLPTRSENFGHVLAEALSASVPVILPDVTPWTQAVVASGAGRVVERTALEIRAALQELADLDGEALLSLRQAAGRAYEQWRRASLDAPHLFDLFREVGVIPAERP